MSPPAMVRSSSLRAGLALVLGLTLAAPAPALAADVTPPSIAHTRVAEVPEGRAFTIEAGIDDESPIFAPAVYVRRAGEDDYVSIAMAPTGPGRFSATIPAAQVEGILEYFIEAFDELGNGPSRAGTPDAPFRVSTFDPSTRPLPEPSEPPGGWVGSGDGDGSSADGAVTGRPAEPSDEDGGIGTKWWFWTLIGTAVVGGAVGTYFLVQNDPCDPCTVEISGPDPAAGL